MTDYGGKTTDCDKIIVLPFSFLYFKCNKSGKKNRRK